MTAGMLAAGQRLFRGQSGYDEITIMRRNLLASSFHKLTVQAVRIFQLCGPRRLSL